MCIKQTIMGGSQMKIKNSKGFTLIELLIVVAIIAILAAIAIPQFSQYRIRGFNASALTDLRNARTSEEALFSDWRRYGHSENVAVTAPPVGAAGVGTTLLGPTDPTTNPTILATQEAGAAATPRGLDIALGANNRLQADTDAAAATAYGSYVIQTKNDQGDTAYGADSDSTGNFRNQSTTYIAMQLPAVTQFVNTCVTGGVEAQFGAAPWSAL